MFIKLNTLPTVLFIALLTSPIAATIATLVMDNSLFNTAKNQYAGLQVILMAFYCLPAIIISIFALLTGNSKVNNGKIKLGKILYITSVLASLIGIGVMAGWVVSTRTGNSIETQQEYAQQSEINEIAGYVDTSKSEAAVFLNNCRTRVFVYGEHKSEIAKSKLATSKEGVIAHYSSNEPLTLFVSREAAIDLLQTAQTADKKCEYLDINEIKS